MSTIWNPIRHRLPAFFFSLCSGWVMVQLILLRKEEWSSNQVWTMVVLMFPLLGMLLSWLWNYPASLTAGFYLPLGYGMSLETEPGWETLAWIVAAVGFLPFYVLGVISVFLIRSYSQFVKKTKQKEQLTESNSPPPESLRP